MHESSGWDILFLLNYLRYWVCNPWTQQSKEFWSLTDSCLFLAASLPCSNSLLIDLSFYYSPMQEIANFHVLFWCWLCHIVNNGMLCSLTRKTPPQPPQKIPNQPSKKPQKPKPPNPKAVEKGRQCREEKENIFSDWWKRFVLKIAKMHFIN